MGILSFTICLYATAHGYVPLDILAKIAQKMLDDASLNKQLKHLKDTVSDSSQEDFEKLQMAFLNTSSFKEGVKKILQEIGERRTEFLIETKDWSVQEILDTFIEAVQLTITAENNSRNLLSGVDVISEKTTLKATGGSKNLVQGPRFSDKKGSGIGMSGIAQMGRVG